MNKPIKTPSKHIPLPRLQQIKRDNYIGESGQEYNELHVNERIIEITMRQADKARLDHTIPEDRPEPYLPPMPKTYSRSAMTPAPKPIDRSHVTYKRPALVKPSAVGMVNLFRSVLDASNCDELPSETKPEMLTRSLIL